MSQFETYIPPGLDMPKGEQWKCHKGISQRVLEAMLVFIGQTGVNGSYDTRPGLSYQT